MRRCRFRTRVPLLGVLLALSCTSIPGPGSGGGNVARDRARRTAAAEHAPASRTTATDPAAPVVVPVVCPDGFPVQCPDTCCPAGSACGDPGCAAPSGAAACDASRQACDEPVDCAAGCEAFDGSPMGNTLEVPAGSSFVPARWGAGLSPAPGGSCATSATAAGKGFPPGDAPVTVEAWVRAKPDGAPQAVLAWGAAGARARRALVVRGGAAPAWDFGEAGCQSLSQVADGAWHHVAGTYEASTARLYLDGQKVGECAVGPLATPPGTAVTVGSMPQGGDACAPFDGVLEEVRVLDVAAGDAAIAADAGGGPLAVTAATVALWRFDEGLLRRCCAMDDTCTPGGGCLKVGPKNGCLPEDAVNCKDGTCCAAGRTCATDGCATPPVRPAACPADAPVACGDGTCCPRDLECGGAEGCRAQPAASPATVPVCPAGQVDVLAADATHGCCPDPGVAGWTVQATVLGADFVCDTYASGKGAKCPDGGPCTTWDWGTYTCSCVASGTAVPCGAGEACGTWGGAGGAQPPGCCPAGSVCAYGTSCCPAGGWFRCPGAPGGCCPAGSTCGAGTCTAAARVATCEGGEVRCGATCCPAGATCGAGGTCIASPPSPAVCGTGIPCGDRCCALGTLCVPGVGCLKAADAPACPAGSPVPCLDGRTCCPAGTECGVGGRCAAPGADALPPAVTAGSQRCGAGWCDAGGPAPRCIDGLCCPAGSTRCGARCCPAEHGCSADGQQCGCDCLKGCVECGPVCCRQGDPCTEWGCRAPCPVAAFPVICGPKDCCAAGLSCTAGDCGCPADYPTPCGDECCSTSARCDEKVGHCVCPAGTTECGDSCCDEGYTCRDGDCVEPGGGGGGGCPTFDRCCGSDPSTATLACQVAVPCGCPPGTTLASDDGRWRHCACP